MISNNSNLTSSHKFLGSFIEKRRNRQKLEIYMSYDMKWLYGAKRETQLLHCVNKTSYSVTNYTVAIA